MPGGIVEIRASEFSNTYIEVEANDQVHVLAPGGQTLRLPVQGLEVREHQPKKGEDPRETIPAAQSEFSAKLPRIGGETMQVPSDLGGVVEKSIGTDQSLETAAKGTNLTNTTPAPGKTTPPQKK